MKTFKSFKGRLINPCVRVEVYKNLNRQLWSVRQKGYVIGHCTQIYLRDVEYIVGERGRQTVLRERRKNVHAFTRGWVCDLADIYLSDHENGLTPDECHPYQVAIYNPYLYDSFVDKLTKARIMRSSFCDMDVTCNFGDSVLAIHT